MFSSVQWVGLTQMVFDLKSGVQQRMGRGVNDFTKSMIDTVHQLYVENLSGGAPSTASRPLPVGVRSGTLLAGAKKQQINQYRGDVFNEVPYSGFIEVGTYKMAPRRPLGNAVDLVRGMVPGEMGEVVTAVVRTE